MHGTERVDFVEKVVTGQQIKNRIAVGRLCVRLDTALLMDNSRAGSLHADRPLKVVSLATNSLA